MRNILVHGYFEIDRNAVWAVVERDLGPFKSHAEAALQQSDDPERP